MNIYVWRHNKTYHSHSMIDEPCVNSEFYLDAIAVVLAHDLEEALTKLAEEKKAGARRICGSCRATYILQIRRQ